MGFFLIAGVIFTVAFWIGAHYVFRVPEQEAERAIASRLRELRSRSGPRGGGQRVNLMRSEQKGTFAIFSDFVAWVGVLRRLQETIDQANLKYRAVDVFVLCMAIALGLFLLLGLMGMDALILRLLISAGLGSIPVMLIQRVRNRRLAKFEETFPDAIDLFNRSMKAGHTIHSGLDTIASESVDPVKMEFRKVTEELGLGSQIDQALLNLGKRVPLIDLKFFITGLILQRQTGANMVEVLENLSLLVRERLNMAAKMKAHTAQQRMSAALLCALPVVVGFGFWVVKPEYIQLLYTDETGSKFLTYAIVSELIGILVIRKLANPKF
jgi:tight adherence protein B